jgi:hypothetical protein
VVVAPEPLPRVKLLTEPAGATIWRGEIKLGITPYEFLYTEDERNLVIQLRVDLDGYQERNVEIHPDLTEPISLSLEELPKVKKVKKVKKTTAPKEDGGGLFMAP